MFEGYPSIFFSIFMWNVIILKHGHNSMEKLVNIFEGVIMVFCVVKEREVFQPLNRISSRSSNL